ncbi:hypothetical protein ES702_05889 [subsurface metagenome]
MISSYKGMPLTSIQGKLKINREKYSSTSKRINSLKNILLTENLLPGSRSRRENQLEKDEKELRALMAEFQDLQQGLRLLTLSDKVPVFPFAEIRSSALPPEQKRGVPDYDSTGGEDMSRDPGYCGAVEILKREFGDRNGNGGIDLFIHEADRDEYNYLRKIIELNDDAGISEYINPSPKTHIPTIIQKPPKPKIPIDESIQHYEPLSLKELDKLVYAASLKESVKNKVDLEQQQKDGFVTPVGELRSIEAFCKIPNVDKVLEDELAKTKTIGDKYQTEKKAFVSTNVLIILLIGLAFLSVRK